MKTIRQPPWLLCAALLWLVAAMPAGARVFDYDDYELSLNLPRGWEQSDRWATAETIDEATTHNIIFQAAYERVARLPADGASGDAAEPERAVMILRVGKGPRAFGGTGIELERTKNYYERRLAGALIDYEVRQVRKREIGDGEPALEVIIEGRKDGRTFQQRQAIFTGANFNYILTFQAFDEHWDTTWRAEWEDILTGVRLSAPYDWQGRTFLVPILVFTVLGAWLVGYYFRNRRQGRPVEATGKTAEK